MIAGLQKQDKIKRWKHWTSTYVVKEADYICSITKKPDKVWHYFSSLFEYKVIDFSFTLIVLALCDLNGFFW